MIYLYGYEHNELLCFTYMQHAEYLFGIQFRNDSDNYRCIGVKVSNIMLKNWHLMTKKLENNTKVKQFIFKICKMLKIWNS